MQPEDYERLRDVTLFSELSEETLGALTKGAFLQRFPSQTVLFSQGDLPDFLYVLLEGSVQFTGTAPDERETVVEILKPIDSFMPAAVLTNTPYLVSAKVVHPARILMVPAAAVHQAIAHDANMSLAMLASLSRQYRALLRQVKDLKLRTSTPIARLLLLAHDGCRGPRPPHPAHRREQAASVLQTGPADRQLGARAQGGERRLKVPAGGAGFRTASPSPGYRAPEEAAHAAEAGAAA